jgi:NADP-dependent 3-hydroxy acid dehydrogenase YdfG
MEVRTYGDKQANEDFYQDLEPILPTDIADMVWFLANQPPHININFLEVMPLCQIPGRPEIIRG